MQDQKTRARAVLALPLFFSALFYAPQGAAQPRTPISVVREPANEQRAAPADAKAPGLSLKSSMGIAAASALLASDRGEDRLRGIERLESIGTIEAIDALLDAMEQGSSIGRDPKARLLAVRVLSKHVGRDSARQFLVRELTDSAGAEGRGTASPLSALCRSSAALALARSGEKKALDALSSAILQGGAPGAAAEAALYAYPPVMLPPFLEGKKKLVPQWASVLGQLGDLRALPKLRAMLGEKDMNAQIAAAVALARLGDGSVAEKVRPWLKRSEPRLQRMAAVVLSLLRTPDAPQAIGVLLGAEGTRAFGVELALNAPSPTLSRALSTVVPALKGADRSRAIAAIGRGGGSEALRQLTQLAKAEQDAVDALHALSQMPGADARATLQGLFAEAASGEGRRRLVRAALVRAFRFGDKLDGLGEALSAMAKEKDESDRAVGIFGQAALSLREPLELLKEGCPAGFSPAQGGSSSVWKKTSKGGAGPSVGAQCDGVAVHSIARGVLALPERDFVNSSAALLGLLEKEAVLGHSLAEARVGKISSNESPNSMAVAAGAALLAHPEGGPLPTALLTVWAEQGGPLSPLAARALASRDNELVRPVIKRLLSGSDPVVRAHVAMGLGGDPEPDGVTLLVNAYRFEEDVGVRRAIVRALSARKDVQRKKTLELARDLDPDAQVRALARSALGGRELSVPVFSAERTAVWITLKPNQSGASSNVNGRTARLVRSDGQAVPVVADPDGVLLVPGLSMGEVEFSLGP